LNIALAYASFRDISCALGYVFNVNILNISTVFISLKEF